MINKFSGLLASVLPADEYERLAVEYGFDSQTAPVEAHPTLMEAAPVMEAVAEIPEVHQFSAETHSVKGEAIPARENKWSPLKSNKPIKNERPSSWTEMLLGESVPTEFESMVDNWLARRSNQKQRLGSGTATRILDSVDGTMWSAKIAFGSEKEEFSLLMDTASDWVVVDGGKCVGC
jgi:hypothetical protein